MRLLTKYNRINIVTTVFVILFTGIIYYWVISAIITDQADKDLEVEENEIFEHVRLNHQLPQIYKSEDLHITFETIRNDITRRFIDTSYYNSAEKENESGRGLISSVMVNGNRYKITITESKVETDDLIRIIFLITLAVILVLVISLLIINRLAINKLWRPFYTILTNLRNFKITDKREIAAVTSDTDEFNELNSAIITMANKANNDYQDLKAFTENASHELLTPIAVINSKLDTLIQTDAFTEKQSNLLGDLYQSVSRLTRVNKSLLLLVKIENNLIQDEQEIDLKEVIEEQINQFQEIYADKKISVYCDIENKKITISKSLLEILLNNLISNAIRHNYRGGRIEITFNNKELIVKNTGKNEAQNADEIFRRFSKSPGSEGTGLGLTIAKQICDKYQIKLKYQFTAPYHAITLTF